MFKVKIASYADEFKQFGYAEYAQYKSVVDDCSVDKAHDEGMFSHKWHDAFLHLHITAKGVSSLRNVYIKEK